MKYKVAPKRKIQKKDGKIHISARVDSDSLDNCKAIANKLEWSLNQTINKAMKEFKSEK
jgi:hypothetical protein